MVCHQACPHKPMKLNTCDCLGHNISQNQAMLFHAALGNITPALGDHYSSTGHPLIHYRAMLIQHCTTLVQHWAPISPLFGNVISCSTGQHYSSTGQPLVHYWAMLIHHCTNYSSTGKPLVDYCAVLFHAALGNVIPALRTH